MGKAMSDKTERIDFTYVSRRHEPASAIGRLIRPLADKIYAFDVSCRATTCDAAELLVDRLVEACEDVFQHSYSFVSAAPTDASGESSVGLKWAVLARLEVRGPLVRASSSTTKVEAVGLSAPTPGVGDEVTYPPT